MPRDVVALVSADDAVAAVRVHADRVHDLLRRSGCGADESVEVTESYAVALIDALVNAPETVVDMAGWWFGRALELGRRLGETAAEPADAGSSSVLAGTPVEAAVRAALAQLPENERAAVVLRDAYDLPPQAVAVALRREPDVAAGLVAAGRLRLVARYDDSRPPDLSGHTARTPADLATLGQLADGSLPAPRTVPLRRHVSGCKWYIQHCCFTGIDSDVFECCFFKTRIGDCNTIRTYRHIFKPKQPFFISNCCIIERSDSDRSSR